MRFLLILALVLSQGPPVTKRTSNQQRADSGARGTQKSPIVIKLDTAQADEYTKGAEQERRDKSATDTNIVRLTAGLLFVGFFQFLLFWRQLNIMQKSLIDTKEAADAAKKAADQTEASVLLAKETAERQLRAYVLVHSIDGMDPVTQPPLLIPYNFVMKNSGQTPAYQVEIHIVRALVKKGGEFPPLPPVEDAEGMKTYSPIPPGGFGHHTVGLTTRITPEIAVAAQHTHDLYIFGRIRYRDAFGKSRTTNFRYVRSPNSQKLSGASEGNESD